MQLDYIDNINAYGDNMVRLYNFDRSEAGKFREAIQGAIIEKRQELDLSMLGFIKSRNCSLVLRLSGEDEGITSADGTHFTCDLTAGGYEEMISLLGPFCLKDTKGHQYLYDLDTSTDFLFSPGGTW